MKFERHKLWGNTTWAYRLFRYHHIQLNKIYWSYAPVARDALQRAHAEDPLVETKDFFSFHTADDLRVPHPLSKWEDAFKQSQTWIRSSLVLVIASILEVYIRTVVSLALESDPGLLIGSQGVVDGVRLLKSDASYSYLKHGEECATGQWQSRLDKYQRLFGTVPQDLKDSLNELEQLRKFRNGVGHTFGRDQGEYKSRLDVKPKELASLSEQRLKKWLGLAEKVVKAVDLHLGAHIGEYETIYFYHSNIRKLPAHGHFTPASRLSRELNLLHGHGPGKTFCKELIRYYEKL